MNVGSPIFHGVLMITRRLQDSPSIRQSRVLTPSDSLRKAGRTVKDIDHPGHLEEDRQSQVASLAAALEKVVPRKQGYDLDLAHMRWPSAQSSILSNRPH